MADSFCFGDGFILLGNKQLITVRVLTVNLDKELCCISRHIPAYTVVTFWKVWLKAKFLEVGIEYAYCHLCMNMWGSPVEIHTPVFLNLISCRMNTCCMLLSFIHTNSCTFSYNYVSVF